jgi:beta-lactamase regulating signal transducer with metallopeptidase domain
VTLFNSFALNFVANALWQVALVAAVAASGHWLMLRSVSARYRHFVWVMALILSIALPLWSALPLERETRWMTLFSTPGAVSNLGAPLEITPIQAQSQQPRSDSIWRRLPFGGTFVGLYLLFLLYRIYKLQRAWKLSLAIRQSAFPVGISDTLREVLEHCRKTIGVVDVALGGSPSVAVPVTIGLRRPVIVLPESLLAETSTELLSAAIGHEMAHIKRRDFAWNLIYELLFLPISFHPAAVLIKRRINETRELACDETVSELLLDAQVYARSLVSLANSSYSPNHTTYILGVNDADILEERVMKLLEKKTFTNTRRAMALLGITLFALTLSGAGAAAFPINVTQDKNSQDKSPDVATAKFFVGTWKGKIRPDFIIDHVLIFKMEGARLTGTQRTPRVHVNPEGEQRLLSDGYSPLPALTVEGKTLSWKIKNQEKPELEYVWKVTLVSDDEILVEGVGGLYRPDQTLELAPLSFKLKKEK